MNKLSKIINVIKLNENNIKMILENKEIAKNAYPGQFVNIKCGIGDELLLRRPISISNAYDDKYEFIFKVLGKGTKRLADYKVGDYLDVLGPLGNGFINKNYKKIAFIGGGIGLFPLLYASKEYINCEKHFFVGFKNVNEAILLDEIKKNNSKVFIASDDGSLGKKGYITQIYEKNKEDYDMVYICGPYAMEKIAIHNLRSINQKGQVSLEERMACGIGACLVCACQTIHGVKHVCSDGPVFDIYEVFNGEEK